MKKCWILLVVLTAVISASAFAQDEGDDFFEDEEYDEPMDFGDEPPPAPPSPLPAEGRPGGMGLPPGMRGGGPSFGGGGNFGGGSAPRAQRSLEDPVEFRLVDPPKYWKPKKRKKRP